MRHLDQARRLPLPALVLVGAAASCAPPKAPAVSGSAEAKVSSSGALPIVTAPVGGASEDDAAVPVNSTDATWGDRRAPVTLVVFGDLQCPYTARVMTTIRSLEGRYGPAELRVVWKHEPLSFHPNARPAAEAADAARALGTNDAFWKFTEQALAHTGELSSAGYEAWAQAAGVDLATFRRAVETHAGAAKVDGDHALADRLKVRGTPTSFVNGIAVVGAMPEQHFIEVIDAELATAKQRLAAGVAPDLVYADRTKTNWSLPPAAPADDDEAREDSKTVWRVPVAGAPSRGRADAPVTIVEFSDFQCPFCNRVEPTLQKVRDTYGDKVRVVWRDEPLPFHPHAMPAAELAREARAEKGEAGFWAAHDALFASQTHLEDDDLLSLAATLHLDPARAKTALSGERFKSQIRADMDLAEDVQAAGTPHFFINGRRLTGAQPFDAFKTLIDEELQHASTLVAQGTPKAAVYDAIMKGAKTADVADVKHVDSRAGAPSKGSASAPVVIEEFSDFQCPFCARVEPTLAAIAKDYGPKVRFVWRNLPLPFHKDAPLAAEAAAEAQRQKGSAAFWAMHDKLFAHQADNDRDGSGIERPALEAYAKELGLDPVAFGKALDEHTHKAELDEDVRAAEAAKINGTPAFVIGGYYLAGAQPEAKFRRVIEHVLKEGPAKAAR